MTIVPLDDFKAAVADGLTAKQIAEKFGLSPRTVYNRAYHHALSLTKAKRGPKVGQYYGYRARADYKLVVKLREQGLTYQHIGEIFGVTRERVRQILHNEGRSDLCFRRGAK